MLTAFVIGLLLTAVFIGISVAVGLHKDRSVYVITLISIALFYVVFALEHGSVAEIILNICIAGLFIICALLGYIRGLYLVGFALIGHGIFDIIYPMTGNSPAPIWWPPFCLAVDVTLGLFLIFNLKTAKVKNV